MNLKEVIELVKKGIIPSCTTIMLNENVEVKKSLANIQDQNWSKIRWILPNWNWSDGDTGKVDGLLLIDQLRRSGKIFNGDAFVSWQALNDFRKFADNNAEVTTNNGIKKIRDLTIDDLITTNWYDLVSVFQTGSNPIFKNGNSCFFNSNNSFLYMRSVINNYYKQVIEYPEGVAYQLGEWINDDLENIQVGKNQTLSDIEKLFYSPVNEIPFVGTIYSVPRSIFYAASGEPSEAVKSAVNVFGGIIRDAETLSGAGIVAPLVYSVVDATVDEAIQTAFNRWASNEDKDRIKWISGCGKDRGFIISLHRAAMEQKVDNKRMLNNLNHALNLRFRQVEYSIVQNTQNI
jgi:hypothetical protein